MNLLLAKGLIDAVIFARTGGRTMGKYSFRKNSGGIHNIVDRDYAAERRRARRAEKRKLKKMNQGRQNA